MRVKLNNKPIADVIDLYLLIKQLIVDVMIDLLYSHIPVHQLGGRLVFKVHVQFNKISNGPKTPVGVQLLSFINYIMQKKPNTMNLYFRKCDHIIVCTPPTLPHTHILNCSHLLSEMPT